MSKAARVEIPKPKDLPAEWGGGKECPDRCPYLNTGDGWHCYFTELVPNAQGNIAPGPACPGPGVKLLIGEEKLTREALQELLRREDGSTYMDSGRLASALRAHLGVS